ncbi:hypothetical protein GCM10027291_35020 [Telluribacter humicola]
MRREATFFLSDRPGINRTLYLLIRSKKDLADINIKAIKTNDFKTTTTLPGNNPDSVSPKLSASNRSLILGINR